MVRQKEEGSLRTRRKLRGVALVMLAVVLVMLVLVLAMLIVKQAGVESLAIREVGSAVSMLVLRWVLMKMAVLMMFSVRCAAEP